MTPHVVSVSSTDRLERAYQVASEQGVSSVPVQDGDRLVGIISLTDLLRVGIREAGSATDARALTFPARAVADEMTSTVETITPETLLADAAKVMREKYIHRLCVTRDGRLAGVLSTTDLMRVIEEKRVNHPVGDYMSSPVFTIRDHEPLGEALERLERGHASGLVVVEDGWPVGIFSKRQALEARDEPRSVAVGDVMSPKILVLPPNTSLHRAAAQASALGVRRVVIHEGGDVKGILSGLDFARAVM
jgi:CBS domain-containing protein